MKILIINGSLKKTTESNTYKICEMLDAKFKTLEAESKIITLNEIDYECGTDKYNDDLQPILNDMLQSDGVVFATPIWWGMYSSYIQSMVERMDYIDTWGTDNKFRPFYNKVFGVAVSGGGDGFQNIHGTLFSFANNLGFTIPPRCNLESTAQENIEQDEDTIKQINHFCTNINVFGKLLKAGAPNRYALHEGARIPRKKGQKRKSSKHSDLYTDEDPKGTIHGLGFKDEATARASVAKIKNSGRSHAHKIQAAVAMEQRAKVAGKASAASVYRKFINSMKKKTKAKNK